MICIRSASALTGIALIAAGCGGDVAGPLSPAGSFVLSAVDGRPLPQPTDPRLSGPPLFVRGAIVLRVDGSYQETVVDSTSKGEVTTTVENGTWIALAGDSLTLTSKTPGRDSGGASVVGDAFRRTQYARVWTFRRQ